MLTVLPFAKLNLHQRGYTYLWGAQTPPLSPTEMDALAPDVPEHLIGPALGSRVTRVGPLDFIASSVSRWPIEDEFNRFGLTSLSGIYVHSRKEISDSEVAEFSGLVLGLARHPQQIYTQLIRVLQTLATRENEELHELAFSMFHPPHAGILSRSAVSMLPIARDFLLERLETDRRAVVHATEPWGDAFALCALIAVQSRLPEFLSSIGTGYFESLKNLWCVTGSRRLPGAEFYSLDPVLDCVLLPSGPSSDAALIAANKNSDSRAPRSNYFWSKKKKVVSAHALGDMGNLSEVAAAVDSETPAPSEAVVGRSQPWKWIVSLGLLMVIIVLILLYFL